MKKESWIIIINRINPVHVLHLAPQPYFGHILLHVFLNKSFKLCMLSAASIKQKWTSTWKEEWTLSRGEILECVWQMCCLLHLYLPARRAWSHRSAGTLGNAPCSPMTTGCRLRTLKHTDGIFTTRRRNTKTVGYGARRRFYRVEHTRTTTWRQGYMFKSQPCIDEREREREHCVDLVLTQVRSTIIRNCSDSKPAAAVNKSREAVFPTDASITVI